MEGKTKCRILKGIRQRIADINGIDYKPHSCTNVGNCMGTCPMCDKELTWLEMQLIKKEEDGYKTYISKYEIEQYEINRRLL